MSVLERHNFVRSYIIHIENAFLLSVRTSFELFSLAKIPSQGCVRFFFYSSR